MKFPWTSLADHFGEESSHSARSPPDFLPVRRNIFGSNELSLPVQDVEVSCQLKRLPTRSAPGPDGISYDLWRSGESSPTLLASIYSICCINKRIPASWKSSNTILIHKKGDPSQPNNWHPISLQPTIYKIYVAILARWLASWAIDRKIISSAQKGFLPYEGCADHSFLLRSVFEDSKRRQKSLRVIWLDLKNAFGSVTHSVMWEMMHRLDIPSHFIDICREIYHGSTQSIRASEGQTSPIPVTRGIKQGCPLSPLLFNLVLEGLLPVLSNNYSGYQFPGGARVRCLAYADDLCLIGQSKEDINDMLRVTNLFFNWAGLELNPSKCGALSMINSRRLKYVEPFEPLIDEFNSILALKWEDAYKYLGVSMGRERRGSMDNLAQSMLKAADKILSSGLTDWQKSDTINVFAISKASYYLDSSLLNVTWASKMDASLRSLLKKALRFPKKLQILFYTAAKLKGVWVCFPCWTASALPASLELSNVCPATTN